MNDLLLILVFIFVLLNVLISIFKKPNIDLTPLKDITASVNILGRIEKSLKDEFKSNREEANTISKNNRDELTKSLNDFGEQFSKDTKGFNELLEKKFGNFSKRQTEINTQTTENVKEVKNTVEKQLKDIKDETIKSLNGFSEQFSKETKGFNELLEKKFGDFSKRQTEINTQTTENVKEVKNTVEKQLKDIRDDNTKQLGEMRNTVDEKLQKTLNQRLSQSFETVGKQLKSVQEGLGEMKNLAEDVGGLKKVLSNVKMRGGLGETQLEMLLEQILSPYQYEANVKTKSSSSESVEFAIKLPGKEHNSNIWLPIDAKFPKDRYQQLVDAYDNGDKAIIEKTRKELSNTIKKMAKDINEKYLNPPKTTNFGIMFLPFESIYAEVVRDVSLIEVLQRDYKVIVAGPTTFAALLNSLQIGFKTLAIEKRSSEVWRVLGAVKKEFENFGGIMSKAQKNIQTGLGQLDDVMGKRTRAIQRKLQNIEELTDAETKNILPEIENKSLLVEEE